jgi:hypothetical protein
MVLIPSKKRAPFTSARGAPPEGFSFLRIFPLRISKTVSFTVYFDSGTASGDSRGSLRSLFAEPLSHMMRLIDAQSWCRAREAGPSLHRVGEAGMFVLAIAPRRVASC